MSSTIRNDVDQVYREYVELPREWSAEQRSVFVDRETARLSLLAAELAAQRSDAAIAAWTERMGREPDYMTTVGLINNAAWQGREQVLSQELYALIRTGPGPAESEQDPTTTEDSVGAVDWGDPDRWRTLRRSEPSPAVTALATRLWPTRSEWFTIKAEYLLQARGEDGLELPSDPRSALAQELAQLVEDDLRSDGLPLR
ncbi:MAG: hypothetical protein L0I76_23315 [Pseudonocardia sp.]|nr:hypothetical protein [Pseudonocardia sp.]MDN5917986.1 hypothetical protein [Pseudonocardia sp.]MDN5932984.1 hypothetical protein [Pseudonocardia sp.]